MAFVFPDNKADFTAPNGVTYSWKDNRWVVKAFKFESGDYVAKPYTVYVGDNPPDTSVAPDGNLKEGELWYSTLTLELFAYGGSKWWPTAADFSGEITAINSALSQAEKDIDDAEQEIDDLQLKVAELEITKGSAAVYQCKSVTGTYTARPGECAFSDASADLVTVLALGLEDESGQPTKSINTGDIIEYLGPTGADTRFRVTDDTSAPLLVVVEFVSGSQTFSVDDEYTVYIYPQNKTGATKDYVDAQDALRVLKTGDTFSSYLDFEAQSGGARFFRGSEKYFSIWSHTADEIRCRVNPGRDFKLTGYLTGDSAEKYFIWWNRSDDKLHIKHVADPTSSDGAVSRGYADDRYLKLSGGTTTGKVVIGKPGDNGDGFAIEGTTRDGTEGRILHVFHNAGSYNDAVNYEGRVDSDNNIQTKKSVEGLISDAIGGNVGVPVGTVMMWMTNTAPDGWYLCKGGSFSIADNPELDAVLQGMHGYKSGKLPDMRGLYPGACGVGPANLTPDQPGYTHAAKTGVPSGGPPKTSYTIPDGGTRKFNGSGGTNAYSDGVGHVVIDEGWDAVTRPPTFAVNFIIRGDY